MKKFLLLIQSRWRNAMPKFFKRLLWICGAISGATIAIHEAFEQYGIEPHEWWTDAERYLIGGSIGAMFVCKFTQNYDNNGNPVKKSDESKD